MHRQRDRRLHYQSRKKAILSEKKVPANGPNKLVWTINMEGSTFLPVGTD